MRVGTWNTGGGGPSVEDLQVFHRIGTATDVVSKEMFDFFDKGDPPQQLALRPELTASICRAWAGSSTMGERVPS